MKRLGPDLKMPQVKVPGVLRELYEDLRDRRLLPLLGLLVVAIVAVPFLLGGGSGEEEEADFLAGADPGAVAEGSQLSVVEATPGLREYEKRLGGRRETDPFKQRYTAPVLDGADLPESSESSSGGGKGEETTSTTTSGKDGGSGSAESGGEPAGGGADSGGSGSSGGDSGGKEGGGSGDGDSKSYTWNVKLRVSHTEKTEGGKLKMGKPVVREQVRMLTPLPGKKNPVVTALGVNAETRKAVFLISDEVTAVFGDGHCVSGDKGECELIELAPDLPQVFEYGANHARMKLQVVKVSQSFSK